MKLKTSHFLDYPVRRKESQKIKIKKISSKKKISNKNELLKTMDIEEFLKREKISINRAKKGPNVSVLKNSDEKLNQKKDKLRQIINLNINDNEILLVKNKNDLYFDEIKTFQKTCENELENLFREKMKKFTENRMNGDEIFSSNKITNFDSAEQLSFDSLPVDNKSDLDIEYDIKFNRVFSKYINKFSKYDNFQKIYSMYMGDIYDNLVEKINNILYPINDNDNKKVTFK